MSSTDYSRDLPLWAFLILPAIPFLVQLLTALSIGRTELYDRLFNGESGLIEILTVLVLVPAAILAWLCARRLWIGSERVSATILAVFGLGCVLLAGEEASWGQHLFDWEPPEFFRENNEKQETNLHNLAGSQRGVIKWIVMIGILAGGVIYPLMRATRSFSWVSRWRWLQRVMPSAVCIPVALFVFVSHVLWKVLRWTDSSDLLATRGLWLSETTELYVAILFLVYAASMAVRLGILQREVR